MPLPLIPIAIALAVSAAGGAAAGTKGAVDMNKAKKTVKKAKRQYKESCAEVTRRQERTTKHLAAYGERQIEVQATTLAAWVDWLEANERQVRKLDRTIVGGVRVQEWQIPEMRKLVDEAQILRGGLGAAVSAVVAQQAALAGVRTLAVAGTGTAISALSGAAAESATLAWLGGGSLAAGGGGIAAGGALLSGVAVAPAVLIGGITLAIQGDKALTQACKYKKDTKVARAENELNMELMKRLSTRVKELKSVLDRLDQRAQKSLSRLSELDFDPDRDLTVFQQTALLMAEIGRILDAPLLGSDGEPSSESLSIIERNAA